MVVGILEAVNSTVNVQLPIWDIGRTLPKLFAAQEAVQVFYVIQC